MFRLFVSFIRHKSPVWHSKWSKIGVGAAVLSGLSGWPAAAEDVPIHFSFHSGKIISPLQCDGIGHWRDTHLSFSCQSDGLAAEFSGELSHNNLVIEGHVVASGAGAPHMDCPGRGSLFPALGRVVVEIDILCWGMAPTGYLTLNTPTSKPGVGTASAVAEAANASAASTSSALQIDPIDETYIAVLPATVRQKPDTASTQVKALRVGDAINVMGRLKSQDWYLVSENDQPLGYVIADQLIPQSQYHPAAAVTLTTATPASASSPSQSTIPAALADLDFGRYEALVIGNDAYANGIPQLRTAASDARAVAQALRNEYGFKVQLLVNATRKQIIGALAAYRRTLTWDDNLLIYYAGHGSYDQAEDQGYWLPVDAVSEDPSNWVSNTDLTSMLRAMQARHVMIVADSCYSGTLTRDADVGVRDTGYIQRMVQKKARTVMTSGGLEPVSDAGGSGHSVFALAFIAALQQNTGVMDAESFFAKVREPVVLAAPQTPEYSTLRVAGHDGGDFVFVRR